MRCRRTGRGGPRLPGIPPGLWHGFGDDRAPETQRAILRRAFDPGITHSDLAHTYGPPPGSAEPNFGRILARDLRPYRDGLVIPARAGRPVHPGPYGERGSRTCLLSPPGASLRRMGLDHVDISGEG